MANSALVWAWVVAASVISLASLIVTTQMSSPALPRPAQPVQPTARSRASSPALGPSDLGPASIMLPGSVLLSCLGKMQGPLSDCCRGIQGGRGRVISPALTPSGLVDLSPHSRVSSSGLLRQKQKPLSPALQPVRVRASSLLL